MAFFIPSYIQKRLLRYALSRVQLFDTDALDLDRLEIGLGRRSNVELRDVALRKTELAALLQLPPTLSIESASTATLRLSIPADVYASPISVHVDGINISARLSEYPDATTTSRTTPPSQGQGISLSSSPNENQMRDTSGYNAEEFAQEAVIPSPEDLAKSFLNQEPKPEAAQLEAELNSQSVNLNQSISSSEPEEENAGYGTGGSNMLPGFLAGFFAGVADRLELDVTNVLIVLNLDLNLPESTSAINPAPKRRLPLAVILSIDGVDIEGVTTTPQSENRPSDFSKDTQELKIGKRLVKLRGLQTRASCDQVTFTCLFPQTKKDLKTQSSSTHSWPNNLDGTLGSKLSNTEDRTCQTPTDLGPDQGNTSADLMAFSSLTESPPRPIDASYHSIDPGHMADVETEADNSSESDDHYARQLRRRQPLLETISPGSMHTALQSFRKERLPLRHERLRRRKTPDFASAADQCLSPEIRDEQQNFFGENTSEHYSAHKKDRNQPLIGLSERSSLTATPVEDEMTESKFFTHDEAESIYMSVTEIDNQVKPEFPSVPGAWGKNSEPGSRTSLSTKEQPPISEMQTAQMRTKASQSSPNDSRMSSDENTAPEQAHTSRFTVDLPGSKAHILEKEEELENEAADTVNIPLLQITSLKLWLPGLAPSLNDLSDKTRNSDEDAKKSKTTLRKSTVKRDDEVMPGTFSVYAESAISARSQINKGNLSKSENSAHAQEYLSNPRKNVTDIEIEVDALSSMSSLQSCSIIAHIFEELQSILGHRSTKANSPLLRTSSRASPSPPHFNLRVSAKKISVAVQQSQEDLKFFNDWFNTEKDLSSSQAGKKDFLLDLRLQDSRFDISVHDGIQEAQMDVGKLTVDVGNQHILRFDQSANLRSSVRDTQLLSDKDFSLHYTQKSSVSQLNVFTLPIIVDVDATRLDDTLDCIGGFSALFDIGSCVLSNNTPENSVKAGTTARPRVRFQGHPSGEVATNSDRAASVKVNVRLGGSSVSIQANEHTSKLSSSPIKIVVREEGIGIQIDELKSSGPARNNTLERDLASVHIRNLGLKYLPIPEEHDLTRLISLVTPTKDNFEQGDGGIMVETMLRQRKKGAALRISISDIVVNVAHYQAFNELQTFSAELSRLGAITKYLPQESRPGMLALGRINTIHTKIKDMPNVGELSCTAHDVDLANVSAPSLSALSIQTISVTRGGSDLFIKPLFSQEHSEHNVMLMARLVGDDIVPTLEVKLMDTCLEYDVTVLMDMMGMDVGPSGVDALAASVIPLSKKGPGPYAESPPKTVSSDPGSSSTAFSNFKLDLGFRDCTIGLTPRLLPSKGQFVLTNVRIQGQQINDEVMKLDVELRKSTLLLIDQRDQLLPLSEVIETSEIHANQQIPLLCQQGYVSVGWISAARVQVTFNSSLSNENNGIDVEFDDELLVLESCADSTQTLSELFASLQPPPPPIEKLRYRTEIATVDDMMASFTGDDFALDARVADRDSNKTGLSTDDIKVDDLIANNLTDPIQDLSTGSSKNSSNSSSLLDLGQDFITNANSTAKTHDGGEAALGVVSGGIKPVSLPQHVQGTAAKWDSDRNKYIPVSHSEVIASPFKLHITNMHIIWNLHDGYDWKKTRDTISDAVQDIEAKSEEKRNRQRQIYDEEEEQDPVIGDFLFNSIYVGVPVNQDPREFTRQINRNVDDLVSETGSHATTMTDATPRPNRFGRQRTRRLKLERSQRHKIAFELSGISTNMVIFPPGQETVSSTDIRVRDFEIFDHVPSSTWKKFATYMRDAGPREEKKPMVHLEVCNVKPVPELLASELVMRVTVLPVRLHVDQDALDFMTRFFDFHDGDSKTTDSSNNQPYLQRVEVLPVPIKLDYKPKKVDYAGLRSGRTKEFMNFFNLDSADMVLKHAIIYGCSSFSKLHSSLEDIWMPDIKRNQLPTVLSGLNGVRTLVNVGSGVRNLVAIPVQEYKKDGRIVRSISKGALSFARTSGSELTKLGARLAVGAQTALQGAEEFLVRPRQGDETDWEAADFGEEEKRAFSHYADQPTGILQGLRGAAKSLERDLLVTRDVIVAVSGEAKESGSVEGAARAVVRHAPTIVLRPMIGASKAVSQTLMGATNTVDPQNRQRLEDKYKRY